MIEEQMEQNSREHQELKTTLKSITDKLDTAIACKADKTTLDELNSRINNRMWTIFIVLLGVCTSLFVWVIQNV